ncbi:hypothetical protein CANARDRAFT_8522 [[Candida] arabinofermentans NRRL YB-2248]|uniref:Uncharacterized protein n=1 Tax=[Candida] arabinofermentans NRRL YB-2248 TaxID=983967 RepID=A0A1E4SYH4_9ASCO|nr:hypothetical protein CANARDRAFT_8522 [[Candida] arabinofermentans NRRL YB-2248]
MEVENFRLKQSFPNSKGFLAISKSMELPIVITGKATISDSNDILTIWNDSKNKDSFKGGFGLIKLNDNQVKIYDKDELIICVYD